MKSILQTGLDKVAYLGEHEEIKPIEHPNIRGREYYSELSRTDREVLGND